jgi:hypothetical protein
MNTPVKIALGLTGALALFGFKKKNDYSAVLSQMEIAVDNIHNLRNRSGKLWVDVDVILINPSNLDFSPITAGAITLKKIALFMGKTLLGNGHGTVNNFDLPAGKTQKIENVQIELLSLNIIDQLFGGSAFSDANNFRIEVTLEALGTTWIIEQ